MRLKTGHQKINQIRLFVICLFFGVAACDSGNIYPVDPETIKGFTIDASFRLLNMETFPDKDSYDILFGTFGDSDVPLVSKNISKPAGETVTVSLSSVPEGSCSIRLSLARPGRQTFYTFYEMPLNGMPDIDMVIPEQVVDLISYDRVQQQVFNQCIVCHGAADGAPAANLSLMPDDSYENLVNVRSTMNFKNRVVPDSAEQSFLMDVLQEQAGLKYNHSTSISSLKANDIVLLKEWIQTGANNE